MVLLNDSGQQFSYKERLESREVAPVQPRIWQLGVGGSSGSVASQLRLFSSPRGEPGTIKKFKRSAEQPEVDFVFWQIEISYFS